MNPPVITSFNNPDPNAAPLNITELVQLLNTLVMSEIQGSYIPYIMSSTTPGVDDQDKAWLKLDSFGRPIALMVFYNGAWRRVYNGMLNEIRMFNGVPGYGAPPALFDANGHGNTGLEYDGWQICNGKNGAPDLSDHFILGAHMNNSGGHNGYDNGWQAYLPGFGGDFKNGGETAYLLNASNTYRPSSPGIKVDKYAAGASNGNDPTGILYGVNSVQHLDLLPPDPGNPTPAPLQIIPPFFAMAFIIFQGYN